MLTEPKNSQIWDLSAIGGRAFTEAQEGADVSSIVASALFRRQPDERRILSELGKASRLFTPNELGKENAKKQDLLWDLMLSIRDALGLGEGFVPNVQLSKNRRFRATRQLLHVCSTVTTFDMTLAIPDAWEGWLQHCHPTGDEIQKFLLLDSFLREIPPAVLRPTVSLFTLFHDARKLAEPRRENGEASHPHQMVWNAHQIIRQLRNEFYNDPKIRQAHGISEAVLRRGHAISQAAWDKGEDVSRGFFENAYFFMVDAALKRKALNNPPPDGFLALGAHMPRSTFKKFAGEIIRYLNDETDELPYASGKCSPENPLGLRTISPKAHKEKRWCAGVVPVDFTDWPALAALQERGFYRIDDPRNVDILGLQRQVSAMVLEVLGPEIWQIT